MPGRTLANAWPTLDEKWKRHYVNAVVRVCETLESWKGDRIGGVDGKGIPEQYLVKCGADYNYDAENLLKACESMCMDCFDFVFYHADLGPGNIIVEDIPETGSVGIIDWEIAGYFPRGWIRTKFLISSGLDLPSSVEDEHWWRWEVQEALGRRGFENFSRNGSLGGIDVPDSQYRYISLQVYKSCRSSIQAKRCPHCLHHDVMWV